MGQGSSRTAQKWKERIAKVYDSNAERQPTCGGFENKGRSEVGGGEQQILSCDEKKSLKRNLRDRNKQPVCGAGNRKERVDTQNSEGGKRRRKSKCLAGGDRRTKRIK